MIKKQSFMSMALLIALNATAVYSENVLKIHNDTTNTMSLCVFSNDGTANHSVEVELESNQTKYLMDLFPADLKSLGIYKPTVMIGQNGYSLDEGSSTAKPSLITEFQEENTENMLITVTLQDVNRLVTKLVTELDVHLPSVLAGLTTEFVVATWGGYFLTIEKDGETIWYPLPQ